MVVIFRVLIYPGIGFILFLAFTYDWLYRKILAKFQLRIGPQVAGHKGVLQSLADFIKTSTKEEIIPDKSHKVIFEYLPIFSPLPLLLALFFIPINSEYAIINNQGDLYAILFLISLFAAIQITLGWASGNNYAMIGASRSGLQLVSFGIPLVFASITSVMLAGSFSFSDIVIYQRDNNWVIWGVGFLAFCIFLITSLAEMEKVPFDTPEAETEIAGGWTVEYSGRKYAFIILSELLKEVLMVGLTVTLFLGGPTGPTFGMDGIVKKILFTIYFLLKSSAVIFILSLLSASLARLKVSQITEGTWSLLTPISIMSVILIIII